MAIVCVEGPSGVGKSTVAERLLKRFGAVLVPEVNFLFTRPMNEPPSWYFERQADRYSLATNAAESVGIAVLDGDPFQPLWYNWAYDYDSGEPAEVIHSSYAHLLEQRKISFPHRYFIFTASEGELRLRKEKDKTRQRKNFERHLRFIKPQLAYFEFLRGVAPGWVEFLENKHPEETASYIAESTAIPLPPPPDPLALFRSITDWISKHRPDEFI